MVVLPVFASEIITETPSIGFPVFKSFTIPVKFPLTLSKAFALIKNKNSGIVFKSCKKCFRKYFFVTMLQMYIIVTALQFLFFLLSNSGLIYVYSICSIIPAMPCPPPTQAEINPYFLLSLFISLMICTVNLHPVQPNG